MFVWNRATADVASRWAQAGPLSLALQDLAVAVSCAAPRERVARARDALVTQLPPALELLDPEPQGQELLQALAAVAEAAGRLLQLEDGGWRGPHFRRLQWDIAEMARQTFRLLARA